MDSNDSYDVIVIGAGAIGIAAARELAADHEVLVVDRGQVAGETTGKASGLITIVPDMHDLPDVASHAIEFFHDYDGTGNFEFTERKSLTLVSAEDEEAARERAAEIAANGFAVEYIDAEEVEARHPDVFDLSEFVGAIEYENTGWVDPYTYAMTLKDDAEDRGADIETGVEVTGVTTEGGRVTGFETSEGAVEAETIVCATGWRTRDLLAEFVELPLRPFRWQGVNLETSREFDAEYPIAWEYVTQLYWRPEHNGDLHVGGGTYFVDSPGDVRTTVTEEFRNLVATTISDRLKGVEDARFAGEDTCPTGDAATPDNYPIFDAPEETPEGLVIATGCPVGGIMTSPVAAAAVRSIITGEDAPFDVDAFALDRFEDRGIDFECTYVTGADSFALY